MHNLSMMAALELWEELLECLQGTHGFGGDTAEIYVYRAAPGISRQRGDSVLTQQWRDEEAQQGNTTLYRFFSLFEAKHEGVSIHVNDEPLGPWMIESGNWHRWHVRVRRDG